MTADRILVAEGALDDAEFIAWSKKCTRTGGIDARIAQRGAFADVSVDLDPARLVLPDADADELTEALGIRSTPLWQAWPSRSYFLARVPRGRVAHVVQVVSAVLARLEGRIPHAA